ncbi:MAG: SpoIIE family protein phosphatase [Magnetococcales bacterium]|nr:SpoIIE family protein phosphatase [Magnetococcales bacterium]MBF0150716.1 SpoIIE family protein phosphatase [Magnetococcales bacterium]MBF0174427.1 SpoIIE family protein phosphatase [Magnetococcales bacterium]MBF0346936.1 SpoIIE family protein phosphatase [Magnetococcales bacterium]MBF0631670.1 SpoIIE family protein phosphatase [Magnetococcales bacterium]
MSRDTGRRPIILVVDDTPENIDVLKGALINDYTVRPALNGQIALKAAMVAPYPDLVLLDIMMPGMDGYEVCRRLKQNKETCDIPIIFVTARSEEADEIEGLQLGAVDYITKPFSIPIVQARIKTHLQLRFVTRALKKNNQKLMYERDLIENIIIKMRGADVLDDRNLRHLIAPVEQTAGDMLLSTFTPEGRQLILLGDFTGHGLPAAIGGPLVTYIVHEQAQREAPGLDILKLINAQLCARLPTGIFFAALLLEISVQRNEVNLWNAAIPEAFLVRRGAVVEYFPSQLPPLGVTTSLNMDEVQVTRNLEPGDRLYLYSDGITEARGGNGDMFGADRLAEFLTGVAVDGTPLEGLLSMLADHTGASTQDDDITLVEVRI